MHLGNSTSTAITQNTSKSYALTVLNFRTLAGAQTIRLARRISMPARSFLAMTAHSAVGATQRYLYGHVRWLIMLARGHQWAARLVADPKLRGGECLRHAPHGMLGNEDAN